MARLDSVFSGYEDEPRSWRRFQGAKALHLECTQVAYNVMRAIFVELPAFARYREDYLGEAGFRRLQETLMANPVAGDVMEGTGGLRKLRFADPRRGKGQRGGLRVIYFWWEAGSQFWLFTVFDKDEASDLTAEQRKNLRARIKAELEARRSLRQPELAVRRG